MGKTIELTASDGHKLLAYRAEPTGKPRGGLIVAMEIFGVNSHIRSVADGYAADGYLALAPALFDRVQRGYDTGYSQEEIQRGIGVIQKIALDDTMKDIAAALQNIASAGKAGIVGYCWGGTVAWVAATRSRTFAAAVSYYGGGVPDLADEQPSCPVQLHFGEQDHAIPLAGVEKLQAAHPKLPVYIYPAGHGFNCDQRASYHAESARLARERALAFLRQHVG
jgi:carboxymethylenebutenolidase